MLLTNCCRNTLVVQWLWPSNRPHPIYFSFAGFSAGKRTAVACTQKTRAISNCWHKHLSSGGVITNPARPQQRDSATVQWRSWRLMLSLLQPYWAAALLFTDWAISSALILDFHISWRLPYQFRHLPSSSQLEWDSQSSCNLTTGPLWDCMTLHTLLHWKHLVRARPAFGGKQDDLQL